ncbi:hypothetical protein LTR17_011036 [Elasticomyces elasticus]|nr:hypothetical protein LTR17_011036 [Elasticomyces elasticus]
MPLNSDLTLDPSKFDPKSISEQTQAYQDHGGRPKVKGWDVGAEEYRKMRWNGETPLPKPASREPGRSIPCRVFTPDNGKPKGVFYHIHGGGWVLQSEHHQDVMLKYWADHSQVTVVSVGYRLAPENPYPAGNEDCFDAGEYLVDNSEKDYGAPLLFMGGDSAGGHLSVVTCYHLLKTRASFAFRGLILNYGAYDISGFMPQAWTFDMPLVLDVQIMQKFICRPLL